jgi:hypothetical protein
LGSQNGEARRDFPQQNTTGEGLRAELTYDLSAYFPAPTTSWRPHSPARRKNKRTIIHFYHPDFRRCRLMDKHLEVGETCLAPSRVQGTLAAVCTS